MIRLVPIKLTNGKTEEFDADALLLRQVTLSSSIQKKGLAIGKVVSPPHEKERRLLLKTPRKVVRKATPEDLDQL